MSPSSIPDLVRTSRLLLRPWRAADAALLHPVLEANVAHLGPWIPAHVATPVPVPALAERLAGFVDDFAAEKAFRFALLTPDSSTILGEADLFPRAPTGRVSLSTADRVEIGYWLDVAVTGQGLATEAARALVDISMTLPGMSHAEIRCDKANIASSAVPRRLGFQLASVEGGDQIWQKALATPINKGGR
jgi:RimJ/RimL family protein N-acetyltransferase